MKYFAIVVMHMLAFGCTVHDRTPQKNPDSAEENPAKEIENKPSEPVQEETESQVNLLFKTAAEANQYLDLKSVLEDCQKRECLFADLEPDLFTVSPNSEYLPSPSFLEKLSKGISSLPRPKAVNIVDKKATFDLGTSIVYGAEDRMSELGMDQKCQDSLRLQKDQDLGSDVTFNGQIETGKEDLDEAKIDRFMVLGNLAISGQEVGGKVPAGSNLSIGFKKTNVVGSMSTTFSDFDGIVGKFRISKDKLVMDSTSQRIWARVKHFFKESVAYAALNRHPAGYPLPMTGYGGDPDAFMPSDPVCGNEKPTSMSCTLRSADWYCHQGVTDACDNPGNWQNQPYCETITWNPISTYYPRIRSKRIVTGTATIQCDTMFPGVAAQYNLGSTWTTSSSNAQWFVSDSNWPGCGGYSCPDKFLRTSAGDDRASNVEPVYNYCVDRWQGLDYNTYLSTLLADCQNTQVFRDAVAARAANDADAGFALSCTANSQCNAAISALPTIVNQFPIATMRSKLDVEEAALILAKQATKSYLVRDAVFSKESVQKLSTLINQIAGGADKAEEFRKSSNPQADWSRGGDLIHRQGTISGFSSYAESKSSIEEYTRILMRISNLTTPSVVDAGCSYSAKGRFRQYQSSELKGVLIRTTDSGTNKAKLLKDYTAH